MKKSTLVISSALSLLFTLSQLSAQVAIDPITQIYKVGSSPEIFIAYSTSGNTFTKQGILDVPGNLNDIVSKEDATQYKFLDIHKTASASGDFDGDGADEVVTVRDNIAGGIKITIPLISQDLYMENEKEYILEELNSMNYVQIRITTGNFDEDPKDEFAICYGGPGETIRVMVFETDSLLNISLLDTYSEIQYYDPHFDIAAGDVDWDGVDELVIVKNEALPTENNTGVNPPIFVSEYDLYILKYNTGDKELEKFREAQNLKIENQQAPNGDRYGTVVINEMRVACGDLDIDGKDEILVGWSGYFAYYTYDEWDWSCFCYRTRYYYRDMVFLNTFSYTPANNEIENVQNLYVTYKDFGGRGAASNQHVALSLKCEKMDNLGRDEVLINGSTAVCILGSTGVGMELEKKVTIAGKGGNLNIGGTESFLVADLNPDTANMQFNKEVILLLSNKSAYDQLNKVADVPSFEIWMTDTVSADTIAFMDPGPVHDLPFGDSDIEISALLTGDFDLKNTDIYLVGTPEIYPVSALQFPLVILNAPPVHFDVLNGTIHDICDAYLEDETPDFSAMYYTKINELNTTSIQVDNSMGFSSEFKAYAMAGGSGFESSVRSNFDMGRSFYKAKSQNTFIEEAKEVYTEDYVLYSSLDYTYYRYPVYDDEYRIIGYLAILNPESTNFSSVWGSGNSWDHPGYIFNHEPGNILSYRPYMNTRDFCSRSSDFSFYEFSRVPVTNTGNGTFKFTFENITSQGSAFSFSAGVGSDFFTQIGVEGTATVNIGAFGIGGSISTDFRAGVSCDLSSYYCSSQLTNHNTELSNSFQVDGKIGRLNENYDNIARYFITPYIYRSQSGALVLDYQVDLDENNMDWWNENYGQKPDLAFILPWKYAVEKGSENIKPSKKQKTSEIQFYPRIVSPGDTVCITARVHNYSLLKFENYLKVRYYLGDPEMGGVELTDIYGETGSSRLVTMMYLAEDANIDFEEYLSFNWQVPDTITCSPRIYAVIDPENEIDEIHESNNRGWNVLPILECTNCEYAENYIDVENTRADLFSFRTYPIPAVSWSRIAFSLPHPEHVTIELFNLSGHKLATVTDAMYAQGEQEVSYPVGNLSEGLYIYKLTAGKYCRTIKFSVMR